MALPKCKATIEHGSVLSPRYNASSNEPSPLEKKGVVLPRRVPACVCSAGEMSSRPL